MKKSFVFLAGMCFYLQFTNVQAQFAKHHWLNEKGVNYTLSLPTTDGHWIIAAPKQEQFKTEDGEVAYAPGNNVIAVLKVDNPNYNIVGTAESCEPNAVAVIGMRQNPNSDEFNKDVHFEVHSVVQSYKVDAVHNVDTVHYILCGTIQEVDDEFPVGMVAVLDSNFKLVSLRRYPDVKVFYSVYAQDGFYYVCGQMQSYSPYNEKGIVLRDSIANPIVAPNIRGFFSAKDNWVYHKIAVRKDPAYQASNSYYEFSVSGYSTLGDFGGDKINNNREVGFSVFQLSMGNISFLYGLWFETNMPINSKTALAYYPPEPTSPSYQATGLLLSVSKGHGDGGGDLYTYVFDDNSNPRQTAPYFVVPWDDCILEDMDCGKEDASQGEEEGTSYGVAWVGNNRVVSPQFGEYARTNIQYPYASQSYTAVLNKFYQKFYNSGGDLEIDQEAYYSLHKVHHFPNQKLKTGDYLFHASGYSQSGDNPNIPCGNNPRFRTTFAVTPESIPASVICKEQREVTTYGGEVETIEFYMGAVRVYATPLLGDTQWYGFCTMDCEGKKDDNCGNRKIE